MLWAEPQQVSLPLEKACLEYVRVHMDVHSQAHTCVILLFHKQTRFSLPAIMSESEKSTYQS